MSCTENEKEGKWDKLWGETGGINKSEEMILEEMKERKWKRENDGGERRMVTTLLTETDWLPLARTPSHIFVRSLLLGCRFSACVILHTLSFNSYHQKKIYTYIYMSNKMSAAVLYNCWDLLLLFLGGVARATQYHCHVLLFTNNSKHFIVSTLCYRAFRNILISILFFGPDAPKVSFHFEIFKLISHSLWYCYYYCLLYSLNLFMSFF